MPLYKYKAITEGGKRIENKINAESKDDVMEIIRSKKMYPLTITEIAEKNQIKASELFSKISSKDLTVFCKQFYTLLNAGLDVINSIGILRQQTENKLLKKSLDDMYEQIQKGLSLSESMIKQKNVFPKLFINMIESGEQTGSLSNVLKRMTEHYEKDDRINSKVKGAMVYPIFLTILSIVVVGFLMTFLIPSFTSMFQGSNVELPAMTKALIAISDGLKNYWYIIIILIILIIIGYKSFSKTDKGSLITSSIKLKLPLIKNLNSKIITSRFTRNLSTILASGVGMIKAIEIISTVVGNKVIEEELMKARDEVMKGRFLADAISEIKVFPPMLVAMVKIGEESGQLDEILENTADFFDKEVEDSLSKMVTLIEPIMILVMGLIVGFIVISIMLPMFDMYSTIQWLYRWLSPC